MTADAKRLLWKLGIPTAVVGAAVALLSIPASKWMERKFDDRRDERNALILQVAEPATRLADTVGTLLSWVSCDTLEENTVTFRGNGCKRGSYEQYVYRTPSARETTIFRYGDSVSFALRIRRPQIRVLFGDSVAFLTDTIRYEIDNAMRLTRDMFPDMETAESRAMIVRDANQSRHRMYDYVSKLQAFTR